MGGEEVAHPPRKKTREPSAGIRFPVLVRRAGREHSYQVANPARETDSIAPSLRPGHARRGSSRRLRDRWCAPHARWCAVVSGVVFNYSRTPPRRGVPRRRHHDSALHSGGVLAGDSALHGLGCAAQRRGGALASGTADSISHLWHGANDGVALVADARRRGDGDDGPPTSFAFSPKRPAIP